MKPEFVYIVFNQYFISDVLCSCKKDALCRINRMNRDLPKPLWRFQRFRMSALVDKSYRYRAVTNYSGKKPLH